MVCPVGVRMAPPREVKCYRRILRMFTWKTGELTHCDGLAIGMGREEYTDRRPLDISGTPAGRMLRFGAISRKHG
jgi:hypothetical protein